MSNEELFPDEELSEHDLGHLTSLLKSLTESDSALEAPPESVWGAILAGVQSDDGAEVIPIGAPLRSRRTPRLLAAAAVFVIAAFGVAGLLRSQPEEVVVATANIVNDNLPVVDDAFGSARLISVDGDLQLEIHVEELATDSGYLELWIINGDVTDMHSLGELNGDGRFDLPDDVDPANFPIVDISVEQRDGIATHSGNSVLRGVLDI